LHYRNGVKKIQELQYYGLRVSFLRPAFDFVDGQQLSAEILSLRTYVPAMHPAFNAAWQAKYEEAKKAVDVCGDVWHKVLLVEVESSAISRRSERCV
jgi:hypothetical protein